MLLALVKQWEREGKMSCGKRDVPLEKGIFFPVKKKVSLKKPKRPIFGLFDKEKISKYGKLWKTDEHYRYYFDFNDACALGGIEITYYKSGNISHIDGMSNSQGWREHFAWEKVFFDAIRGEFNLGSSRDSEVAYRMEQAALADMDDETRAARLLEKKRRLEELANDERQRREKKSLERDSESFFGEYDETTIRRIGNKWTKRGIRFYIDITAASELLELSVKDFRNWYKKTYFDAIEGKFIFSTSYGDESLEKKLEKACRKQAGETEGSNGEEK